MGKKRIGLSDKERFCLDAYIINKDADLAYLLSRTKQSICSRENLHRMALKWLRSTEVKIYIDNRQQVLYDNIQIHKTKNRDKSDVINELNTLASSTSDVKLKADILKQITDLQQMKKDETKGEEDNTIHYYLPLSCHNCNLYIENKRRSSFNEENSL